MVSAMTIATAEAIMVHGEDSPSERALENPLVRRVSLARGIS